LIKNVDPPKIFLVLSCRPRIYANFIFFPLLFPLLSCVVLFSIRRPNIRFLFSFLQTFLYKRPRKCGRLGEFWRSHVMDCCFFFFPPLSSFPCYSSLSEGIKIRLVRPIFRQILFPPFFFPSSPHPLFHKNSLYEIWRFAHLSAARTILEFLQPLSLSLSPPPSLSSLLFVLPCGLPNRIERFLAREFCPALAFSSLPFSPPFSVALSGFVRRKIRAAPPFFSFSSSPPPPQPLSPFPRSQGVSS